MRTEFTSSDKVLVTNSNGTTYRGNLNQFFKYIHTMSGSNSINSSQDYVISTNNINRFEITSTGNINMGTSISMPTIHIASTNTMEGDRIGIFTNNPRTPLEINSKTSGSSGLSFTLFNSGSSAQVGAPIGVNGSGTVVKIGNAYKCYTAYIVHDGVSMIGETVLNNTFSFTPTWNFGPGDGTIRCTGGGFTEGRTGISILGSESTNTTATWISTSEISLSSWNMNPEQTMIKILIEIRIYKQ